MYATDEVCHSLKDNSLVNRLSLSDVDSKPYRVEALVQAHILRFTCKCIFVPSMKEEW